MTGISQDYGWQVDAVWIGQELSTTITGAEGQAKHAARTASWRCRGQNPGKACRGGERGEDTFPGQPFMLLFKKKFLPAIRSGEKTQTIRLWNCRRMRTGQRSYIPGAGYIHVTSVEAIEIDQLDDSDAAPDGFATAQDLRDELLVLYAEQIGLGYQAYRIRFELVPKEWQPAEIAAPQAKHA